MIDTVYEYAGYTLAAKMQAVLWGVGLPLILALAGVAYTVHSVTEKGSVKDLLLYFFYLLFAAWILSPAKQQNVAAPRFLSWLGRATDTVQARATTAIHKDFLSAPFEWERIAARVSFGRVTDIGLEARMDRFLDSCAKTALAVSGPPAGNLFRPGSLPYSPDCERARAEIWARLEQHVKSDDFHRRTVDAAAAREPAHAAAFRERYLDELCTRAVEAPGSPVGEARLITASLGDYSYADPGESAGFASRLIGVMFGMTPLQTQNKAAVLGVSELTQAIDLMVSARQKYYMATVLAPHVYGLSLMILLGLFPVAGLFAILPGQWRTLVNFGKIFVSVKLWPVCWAALTTFNAKRGLHEVFEPAERGSGDVGFVVAAMYFLTPAIAFLVVQLATRAAAMPFAAAMPPPSGAPIAPAAAVSVAVRQVRP